MRVSRRKTTLILASALLAGGLAAPAVALGSDGDRKGGSSSSLNAVGLSKDGKALFMFRTNAPRDERRIGSVDLRSGGANHDRYLVGIDYRVQDGKLYGVGDQGGIYVFQHGKARGAFVGDIDPALEGRHFGVDFNPAANALRVVSDTGQNLRQPFMTAATGDADTPNEPDEATVVDGRLNYPLADGSRGPDAAGISGAAYTNNDLSPDTGTFLYDIDTTLDQLAIQQPANSGTLGLVGKLRAGNVGPDAGFDIYSTVRNGVSEGVDGFAVLTVNGSNRLYGIALDTGRAGALGTFDAPIADIAIPLAQR